MNLKLGQCPVSWGVEEADAATNPPWERYLDEAAAAGYQGVELGPVGYLPRDPDRLADALAQRGLELCAGYVMEPLENPTDRDRILEVTAATAKILAAAGARQLILIDDMHPERSRTAGRSEEAQRLGDEDFARLIQTAHDVARLTTEQHGLTVAFHPHVGTYVEFRDEIDRFVQAADPSLIDLCIDSGHSVYAGVDPTQLYKAYAEHVTYLHLKDVQPVIHQLAREQSLSFDEAVARGIFCPVGQGSVDYPELLAALDSHGFGDWMAVEQDRTPGYIDNGGLLALEDARSSCQYIRDQSYAGPAGSDEARAAEEMRP